MAQPLHLSAFQAPPTPATPLLPLSPPFHLRDAPGGLPDPAQPELHDSSHAHAANERQTLALVELGRALIDAGYEWICPTQATHARVNGRFVNRKAHDLRGVFGWSRPCEPEVLDALPPGLVETLCEAGVLQRSMDRETLRSRVRFSSLAGTLLAHSAWPTHDPEAVFLGPDTYRFAAFLERELGGAAARQWAARAPGARPFTVADVGCGTGAGGILAARLLEEPSSDVPKPRLLFTDLNPRALRYTRCNAQLAGLSGHECLQGEGLQALTGPIDLVMAHPPYLMDPQHSSEPHDGGPFGTGPTLRVVEESLQRLVPGGRLLLYAGAPVVDGVDVLWRALQPLLARAHSERAAVCRYSLIDPDVCATDLPHPEGAQVERIGVVGLSVLLPSLR